MPKETVGKAGKGWDGWLPQQRRRRRWVSDESQRPWLRSAALFGLAPAPGLLPLRNWTPWSPPAPRPRPPPSPLSLLTQPQGQQRGGSMRANIQSTEFQALAPSFPHVPHRLLPSNPSQTGRLPYSLSLASCRRSASSTAAPSAFYLPGIPHKAFT